MKWLDRIERLFTRQTPTVSELKEKFTHPVLPLDEVTKGAVVTERQYKKFVKSESIPLSKRDIQNNHIKRWLNRPIKKKAHRLPLAKMMNPEKYF